MNCQSPIPGDDCGHGQTLDRQLREINVLRREIWAAHQVLHEAGVPMFFTGNRAMPLIDRIQFLARRGRMVPVPYGQPAFADDDPMLPATAAVPSSPLFRRLWWAFVAALAFFLLALAMHLQVNQPS